MLKDTIKQLNSAVLMLLTLSLITGVIYPMFITAIAQSCWPKRANGSLIIKDNKVLGSSLIGQHFQSAHYFWGRPSSTKPEPYNAMASAGSNFGPSNPEFLKLVEQRVNTLAKANPEAKILVPVDLVTASASGLDPHISLHAAFYQVPRVAKARNISQDSLRKIIGQLFGDGNVNVLQLNLALDEQQHKGSTK